MSYNDKEWRTGVTGLKKLIFSAVLGISEVACFKDTFYKRLEDKQGFTDSQGANWMRRGRVVPDKALSGKPGIGLTEGE